MKKLTSKSPGLDPATRQQLFALETEARFRDLENKFRKLNKELRMEWKDVDSRVWKLERQIAKKADKKELKKESKSKLLSRLLKSLAKKLDKNK